MEQRSLLCFLWLVLLFDLTLTVAGNAEGDALTMLKKNLSSANNVFQSWNNTLPTPCDWFHVTCNTDKQVTRVDLGNADLSGKLVPELGQLSKLQYLELYSNKITGEIPEELGDLRELVSLELFWNNISGPIPSSLGKLKKLRILRLNNNSLSGEIPMSLTALPALQVLDLSNNQLSGDIPVNGSFALFTPSSFQNNKFKPLTETPPTFTTPTPPPPSGSQPSAAIARGVAAGAALLSALVYWPLF